jgi:16S rRNA G966 N2-methylase RsmD
VPKGGIGVLEQAKVLEIWYLPTSEVKVNTRFRKSLGNLDELKESINQVGLLQPIGVSKEKVLVFGQRRLEAWKSIFGDFEPIPSVVVDGDLYKFKLAEFHENLKRKDMDWQDQVLAVEEIQQTFEELYGVRGHGGDRKSSQFRKSNSSNELDSQKKIAVEIGISTGKLSQDLQLAEAIKTTPKVKEAKTKKAALRKLKTEKHLLERNEALKASNQKLPDNITLYNGQFLEQIPNIEPNSVQLILTDPPYGEEYLPLWEKLSDFADKVLAPSGFLVAYSGQFCLPRVFDVLRSKLEYFWTIALELKQNQLVHSRNVFCEWKPLVVFFKPPLQLPTYFGDLIKGTGREKDFHDWQQAEQELEQIIETFCPANGIILDPMAGSGTTLVVANRMKRKCIGIELNADTFEAMKRRLADATA